MTRRPSRQGSAEDRDTADRLHSAAIHLLRRLRTEDSASGLSAPRLSALSVVIVGGPITLGALAAAEQVRPPTITRLVRELEREGLVELVPDPEDGRVRRVRASVREETNIFPSPGFPVRAAILMVSRARSSASSFTMTKSQTLASSSYRTGPTWMPF